jgi:hypothetical protein
MLGQSSVSNITTLGTNLVLRYAADFNGNAMPVAITLVPDKEKVTATFSFADGQFEMAGVATKKP